MNDRRGRGDRRGGRGDQRGGRGGRGGFQRGGGRNRGDEFRGRGGGDAGYRGGRGGHHEFQAGDYDIENANNRGRGDHRGQRGGDRGRGRGRQDGGGAERHFSAERGNSEAQIRGQSRTRATPFDPNYNKKPEGVTFNQTAHLLKNLLSENYDSNFSNITITLLDPQTRFLNFLNYENRQNSETIKLILGVVLKALENRSMEQNNQTLLKEVMASNFCKRRLDNLINIDLHTNMDWEMMKLLTQYFINNLSILPGLAYDALSARTNNLLMLSETATLEVPMEARDLMEGDMLTLKEILRSAEAQQTNPQKRLQRFKSGARSKECPYDNDEPPDDFHEMTIFPSSADLLEVDSHKVFLRSSKTRGVYKSVEDYLDVQFRLMREDFIQPLRDGLNQYKSNDRKRQFDIRVYKHVSLINSLPADRQGIVHNLQFDQKEFRKIRWNQSRRFLFGSLLCLSKDKFKTLMFATVADRKVDHLVQGVLTVKFYDCRPAKDVSYTLIESTNMFESYRHVLVRLQAINAADMCLQKYLVFAEEKVDMPQYVRQYIGIQYEFDKCKLQPGLPEARWPRPVEIDMDESQFAAFRAALTSEISIIQGPPGTGKTYLGLKICRCLLTNVKQKLDRFGPILVVCYTNHALDQFMEGIAEFTKKIVRIGNRSKSEQMQQFSLIRWKEMSAKQADLDKRRYNISRAMREMRHDIFRYQVLLKTSHTSLIKLHHLEGYISEEHLRYLKVVGLKNWLYGSGDEAYEMEQQLIRVRNKELYDIINNITEWLMFDEIMKNIRQVILEAQVELTHCDEFDPDLEINYITDQRKLDIDQETDIGELNEEFEQMIWNLQHPIGTSSYDDDDRDDIDLGNDPLVDNAGFQVYRTKTTENLFRHRLRQMDHMSQEEAIAAVARAGLGGLSLGERWSIYRYWRHLFIQCLETKSLGMELDYEKKCAEHNEITFEVDRRIMMQQDVVGMTTTGAARYGAVLSEMQCKIIIVEEAAEVLESHVVASLNPGCQQLVLIGDHKQLQPSPAVYRLARTFNLSLSLFERLLNNSLPVYTLRLQHRMRPEIAVIMRHIYTGPNELQNHCSVLEYPPVPALDSNLFFFDHTWPESHNQEIVSYANEFEAEIVVRLARHLMKNGVANSRITILTLYSGQMFLLRHKMDSTVFQGVRVCVVDNYQGEENDIILLSLVRSNENDKIGFLAIENRICVSLSRAKQGLFVFGNFGVLTRNSELWKAVCLDLRNRQQLGPRLRLRCQNHPEKELRLVETAADFDHFPEGGCEELCQDRLDCGHACRKACHFLDRDHKEYKCLEACQRLCVNKQHICRLKCYETCRKCQVNIMKKIPECGHDQLLSCSRKPCQSDCKNECDRILPDCGHKCLYSCKEKCGPCKTQMEGECEDCGQVGSRPCSKSSPDDFLCEAKCGKMLPGCDHVCAGNCTLCLRGRLHQDCRSQCRGTLICGHVCNSYCSAECPPCEQPCEEGCCHNVCSRRCGEPCVACLEPCKWRCAHQKCTRLCHEICNRLICDEVCEKLIQCTKCRIRFQCYGVCGEPCRTICVSCDPSIREILFGNEDEDGARFITLWTCGHSFEVTAMDKFMEREAPVSDGAEIVLKRCPSCRSVINKRSCFRYANQVKLICKDIKEIQVKISEQYQEVDGFRVCRDYDLNEDVLTDMFRQLAIQDNHFQVLRDKEKRIPGYQMLKMNVALKLTMQAYKELFMRFVKLDRIVNEDRDYISRSIRRLLLWLQPTTRKFNEFDLSQFHDEMNRIKTLFVLNGYRKQPKMADQLQLLFLELKRCRGFTKETSSNFQERLNAVVLKYGYVPNTAITETERQQIVQAINLGKGRWFKCPNGHFYLIGECGGATEVSRCPECGARIGGLQHTLQADNRFAPEIDGAVEPAWPNMDNPVPNPLLFQ